jgi:hypothetical protein
MDTKRMIKEIIRMNRKVGIRLDLAIRITAEKYDLTPRQADDFVIAWKLHEAVKECELDLCP